MPFYIEPGEMRPIMALNSGDSLRVKLAPAEQYYGSQLWEDFWDNPLVKNMSTVPLGYFEALYEHINRTELVSSVNLEWEKSEESLGLWGMAIQTPEIRPRPLSNVDTNYWRMFPRTWFQKFDN